MTETERRHIVEDESFVANYMYLGRGSRRPWRRLAVLLGFAVAFVVGAQWLYADLAAWEADPNAADRWENAFVVMAYEAGGKELVRAIGMGFGALFAGVGIVGYARDRSVVRRSRS